jgi:predicted alpha/beta-hydrolase family hydrolase
MNRKEWKVRVGEAETSAMFEPAEGDESAVFVCAHGAGGNMLDRSMASMSKALREHGLSVVRFNFLYKERKSGRPDPMPKLQECFSAVVAHARSEVNPKKLIIGGRSMGGRAASMMASENFECDGLLLFAYPLHPPGQPEKLRDAHLPSIKVPVLCFNGTRDPFCTRELMDAAVARVTTKWEMRWVDNADHSFHVPKSSGKTDSQVMAEMAAITEDWVRRDITNIS